MTLKRIITFVGDANELRSGLIEELDRRINQIQEYPFRERSAGGKLRAQGELNAYESFKQFLMDVVVHPH